MGSSKFSPCVIIPLWLLTFDKPNWPPRTRPLLFCRQSPIYSLFVISLEKLLDNDCWTKTLEKCSKTCFPARPLLTSKSWSRKIFVAFQCKSSFHCGFRQHTPQIRVVPKITPCHPCACGHDGKLPVVISFFISSPHHQRTVERESRKLSNFY